MILAVAGIITGGILGGGGGGGGGDMTASLLRTVF